MLGATEEVSDRQSAFVSLASDLRRPLVKANGLHSSGVEMVAVQTSTYTSLRDLLPAAEAAPAVLTPTYSRRQSWEEIPIKNPLVQKGAWAYLRPMTVAPATGHRGVWAALKDRCGCGGEDGCIGFLNGVVLAVIIRTVRGLLGNKSQFDSGPENNENVEDDKSRP